jgi:hypothetical protein
LATGRTSRCAVSCRLLKTKRWERRSKNEERRTKN